MGTFVDRVKITLCLPFPRGLYTHCRTEKGTRKKAKGESEGRLAGKIDSRSMGKQKKKGSHWALGYGGGDIAIASARHRRYVGFPTRGSFGRHAHDRNTFFDPDNEMPCSQE